MPTISRRLFLQATAGAAVLGGSASYAFAIEPAYRLKMSTYRPAPANWPRHLRLRIAALADFHVGEPYMGLERIEEIIEATNALEPDLVLMLGDYAPGFRILTRPVELDAFAALATRLKAPLGVHAILGNHDWWDDEVAQRTRKGPTAAARALRGAGIPVLENDAVRLVKDGSPFWILGLGDQIAFLRTRSRVKGVHDLPGTLAQVTDDAPAILLAHEPDIFVRVPDRVALTLSGHTHGGQVRILGYSPVVPSRYGNRFAYGHVVEGGRHLIVSGGLGTSKVPVRLGVPPEIVLVELGDPLPAAT